MEDIDWDAPLAAHQEPGSLGEALQQALLAFDRAGTQELEP